MFVVFALDGTLALTEHRADFLNWPGSTKDWHGFYPGSIYPQEVATWPMPSCWSAVLRANAPAPPAHSAFGSLSTRPGLDCR